LLPGVVVAAAAISNIAQISFLQTLAAKNTKTHHEKGGKKKPKACCYCALCNYTTGIMMQKKDKEDDDEEEDEQEGEKERERGRRRWGENMVQESSSSGHTRNQRGEWTDAKPRKHDGWME
jgi:hypothetical protein